MAHGLMLLGFDPGDAAEGDAFFLELAGLAIGGGAGVEVRLTVLHGTATRDATITSDDRYNWLKLGRSY